MSSVALAWAWDQNLPPAIKFTLVALADRSDEEGVCWPSVKWIVKKTGLAERTVREHLTALRERGLLVAEERVRDDGGRSSNLFKLQVTQPAFRFETPPAPNAGGGAPDAPTPPAPDAPPPAPDAAPPLRQMHHPPAPDAPHDSTNRFHQKEVNPLGVLTPAQAVDFETLWITFPRRNGNNPRKDAEKCYRARLREGVGHADMLAGVQRYARWVEATGKANTEKVMRASTFLGPSRPFEQTWELPETKGTAHLDAKPRALPPVRCQHDPGCKEVGAYRVGEKKVCAAHYHAAVEELRHATA